MDLHGRRNLNFMTTFLTFVFWFGLRLIFSENLYRSREVQPRELL